jgi:RHS repeat-associated protein
MYRFHWFNWAGKGFSFATGLASALAIGAWIVIAPSQSLAASTSSASNASAANSLLVTANSPSGFALSYGQAITQLPDGTWLVSGGASAQSSVSNQLKVFSPTTGRTLNLAARLQVARASHTATLLGDGTVLIHGGVDAHGLAIQQSEIFDPVSGQSTLLAATGLLARAHHAATVLSDGCVLITGGVDQHGTPVSSAEIYNPLTMQVDTSTAGVDATRLDAAAVMLPNGTVLVSGGVDATGKSLTTSSLYDPVAQTFSSLNTSAAQTLATPLVAGTAVPSVVTSLPAASAVDVGVGAQLMVRFSTRLNESTLSAATVTLIGPGGATPLKAVGVDSGVLLFVTPTQQLLPASQYTLFVQGAQDNAKHALPLFSFGFTTQTISASASNGSATTAIVSNVPNQNTAATALTHSQSALSGIDEEWVPQERNRHGEWMSHRAYLAHSSLPQQPQLRQLIQRRTPTVPDAAALVTAHAVSEQSPRMQLASWHDVDVMAKAQDAAVAVNAAPGTGVTSLTGQVLRLNGLPLANVTMQVGAVVSKTDAHGEFTLSGVPSGNQVITINATTANRPDATYGRFQYLFSIQAGKTNLLPFTIWMPKLDTKHAIRISSPTQQDTVISNPTMPGLSITLPAGTVVRDVDGKIVTEVSLTPIPADQPPYPMPYAGVPLHYTIQPGGATIQSVDGKPKGAVVRYPNYTSFGPGTPVQLFDYDPKGRGWYVYAKAQVATNGSDITSDRDFLIYQFGTTSYSSGGPSQKGAPPCTCSAAPAPGTSPPAGGGGGSDGGQSIGSSSGCPGAAHGAAGGDPVDLHTGWFTDSERDLYVKDVIPIDFVRTYKFSALSGIQAPISQHISKSFGVDSTNPYEVYLTFDPSGTEIEMTMSDGSVVTFDNANGSNTTLYGSNPYDQLTYQNTTDHGGYRNAYVTKDSINSAFVITFEDGRHWGFSAYSARIIWVEDRVGNRMTFARPNVNAYVSQVTSPNGRFVNVAYNTNGQISSLTDNLGRQFTYSYAGSAAYQDLKTVTDPNGKTRSYGWDQNNFLVTITDPNGVVVVNNNTLETGELVYVPVGGNTEVSLQWASGRVLKQTLADGSTFTYSYNSTPFKTEDTDSNIPAPLSTLTSITDRRGVVRQVALDGNDNVTTDTEALGKPEQQVSTYVYNATTNLLTSMTDALNRQTTYQYDTNGNLTQTTRLAGTANAVSTSATYDPVFNQPLTLTDGNGHTSTLGYDGQGNLTSAKDALGHVTTLGRDFQGRVSTITNALGKTTQLSYVGADLSAVTDPLSRQTQFITDAVGRVMTQIDGLGNRTYNTWDPLNRLTQITDALGGLTKFTYDNDDNVLTQTDANNHATTFTYSGIGQVATKKDALLNLETSLYEPGGLLSRRTDRKGQVSGVTYDNLGRVATIGFGATTASPTAYTSTAALTWDAGNRLTTIVDVQAGKTTTIARTFDGLNRMTSEVTEQGEVDYTYDNGGRRTTMVVKNGPSTARVIAQSVAYTYDAADRLTQIAQASGPANNDIAQTITFAYDNANRLTTQTVSSGPITAYTYTDADEIASITYKTAAGTVITSGTYAYDAAGHRTSVTGGLATFVQASGTSVTGAVYNANNQLTSWNGKTFAYDNNGNLMSDGVNLYAWDARNQLLGMSGGTSASFQYDGQGRRLAKTVAGATTAFAYDGNNFVQELAGLGNVSAVNANLITGGVDQTFMRGTGTGSTATLHWVLPEANNSTVIMSDSSGNVQKSYAYDPYGNTTPGTGTDTNSQQYTGRENDGTGLYLYRNRYYMPGCNRFISEDPIGWASGQTNNYAYVGGNPVSYTDPYGLCISQSLVDGIAGGAGGFVSGYISSGFNPGVGIATGLVSGVGSYLLSGQGLTGGMAAGASSGFGSFYKGGGGPAAVLGGIIGGGIAGGLSVSDTGALPNTASGALGGGIAGLLTGVLTPRLGNNPLPITLGVLGLVGGAAGGLVQDLVTQALSGYVCQ